MRDIQGRPLLVALRPIGLTEQKFSPVKPEIVKDKAKPHVVTRSRYAYCRDEECCTCQHKG